MAILIGVVGYETRTVLISQAEQSQDRQVEVLASQLDTAYGTIIDNTERLATTFKGLYPDALVLIGIKQFRSVIMPARRSPTTEKW